VAEFSVIGLATILLFMLFGPKLGSQSVIRKFVAALNVWIGLFCGAMLLTSLWGQRHLPDAAGFHLGTMPLTLTILLPLVVATFAWLLVPSDPPLPTTAPVPADAPRANILDGTRAVWLRRVTSPVGCVIAAGGAILMLATAYWLNSVAIALWAIPLLLLCAAMFAWTIRIDHTGVTVRSVLGFPRTHIPLNEVTRAPATQVEFSDFGGWGYRVGLGGNRVGVITRYGDALLVERTAGRGFVVTTDDAAAAAAVLNTLTDQSRR